MQHERLLQNVLKVAGTIRIASSPQSIVGVKLTGGRKIDAHLAANP